MTFITRFYCLRLQSRLRFCDNITSFGIHWSNTCKYAESTYYLISMHPRIFRLEIPAHFMLVLRQTVPDMRNLNQLLLKQWLLNHHSPVLQLLISICFLSTILKYFSPPHRRFGRSTTVYSILQII